MTELFYKLVSTWSYQYRIHSFIHFIVCAATLHCSCCALFDKCHCTKSYFLILHANGDMGSTDSHSLEACKRMGTPGRPQWISFISPAERARGLVSDNIVLILSGLKETQR